jgi:hypothetical protein
MCRRLTACFASLSRALRRFNPIPHVGECETPASPSLLDLPDELLLTIVEYSADTLPRHRRRDLVVLTTVCNRVSGIATELLHGILCTGSLYGLKSLVYLYAERPELGGKVKSLEMFNDRSRKRKKSTPWVQNCDRQLSPKAQATCREAMRRYRLSADNQDLLLLRLTSHDQTAILTMALILMPNLHALLLGDMGLSISIFSTLYLPWGQQSPHVRGPQNAHPYYDKAFARLAGQLVTLELPSSLRITADLRMCSSLKTLSIDFASLRPEADRWGTEFQRAFPTSLRTLTIHSYDMLDFGLVQSLLERKRSGELGNLQTLELHVLGGDGLEFFSADKFGTMQHEKLEQLAGLGVAITWRWNGGNTVFRPSRRLAMQDGGSERIGDEGSDRSGDGRVIRMWGRRSLWIRKAFLDVRIWYGDGSVALERAALVLENRWLAVAT